jgi:hypothetical protein
MLVSIAHKKLCATRDVTTRTDSHDDTTIVKLGVKVAIGYSTRAFGVQQFASARTHTVTVSSKHKSDVHRWCSTFPPCCA